MLDKLIELGIREIDINNIKEFINEDNSEEFNKIIELLRSINCNDSMIRNIVVGNPIILQRDYEDILEVTNYLTSIGFKNLNLLYDSYPMFLNKDVVEIKDYIESKVKNNISLEDIIDELENNPLLIEELE